MKDEIEKVKNRADKMIGNKKIVTLINEAELITKINDIANNVDETNYYIYDKTLDAIEKYLIEKEKLETQKEDMTFLRNLAKELREQQVRITDQSNPPLFVISTELGNDIYFLTRKALEDYSKFNIKNNKKVVEIPSNRSVELSKLLDIIKRNF
jgi:hypothetical protein